MPSKEIEQNINDTNEINERARIFVLIAVGFGVRFNGILFGFFSSLGFYSRFITTIIRLEYIYLKSIEI